MDEIRSEKPRLVILAAVITEAQALAKKLGMKPTATPNKWTTLSHPEIHLYVIGIGAGHVPADLPSYEGVILAGLAGALDPNLKVGDVLLDQTSSPKIELTAVKTSRIASASHMITTPAAKSDLYHQTGALAVEMECATVRKALSPQQAFLHLRAISDTANEELDPVVLSFIDELGRLRWVSLAAGLLKRPSRLAYLLKLQKHCNHALSNLGHELTKILTTSWPRI